MHLSVSNILWAKGKKEFPIFLEALRVRNYSGVELALSCLFDEPANVLRSDIHWIKEELKARELQVSALHSLTFTRPDLTLFGSEKSRIGLIDYLKAMSDLARELGTKNVVFGSPKARQRGELSDELAQEIFMKFLKEIDPWLEGLHFNLEPLSKDYCNFLNSYAEAYSYIESGEFQNIFIQLDLKALHGTESYLPEWLIQRKKVFPHVHVSNLDFGPVSDQQIKIHEDFIQLLARMQYQGMVALEALTQDMAREQHLNAFKEIYGRAPGRLLETPHA